MHAVIVITIVIVMGVIIVVVIMIVIISVINSVMHFGRTKMAQESAKMARDGLKMTPTWPATS